jgi:HEAT repeat protein
MRFYRWSGLGAASFLGLWLAGCGEAATTAPAAPPVDDTPNPILAARSGAQTSPAGRLDKVAVPSPSQAAADLKQTSQAPAEEDSADERLVGLKSMALDFPWGKGEDGRWLGTGSPDPEPIRDLTDAEMLAAARGEKSKLDDRLSALVSIARRHLPEAVPMATALLNQQSAELLHRQVALSALIEHGGPEALPVLWQTLKSSDQPRLRGSAVWAIALYGTSEAMRAIDAAMADADPGVRGMGVLALTAIRDNGGYVWRVLEVAVNAPEQQVYQEGAYVLSQIADARAMKMLGDALDRAGTDTRKVMTFRTALRAGYARRAAAGATGAFK